MKRKLLIMLSLVMAGMLVACGSKEEPAEEAGEQVTAADIQESEDAVDLTQEEVDAFTEMFNTAEYNGYVVKPFNSVDDIEWGEIFYCGAGIDATDVTAEEKKDYYKEIGLVDGEEYGDLTVLRADDVKKYVEAHAGDVDFEDVKKSIYADYLEKYDSFYSLHGDSNWMTYNCTSGKKLNDMYVLQLSYEAYDDEPHVWDNPDAEITLVKNGDVYRVVSNVWNWEVGNDPAQTFDINVPGYDTPGRLITYQGTEGEGNGAHIIITAEGKRIDWLGTWYWDDNNNSIDFVTIDAVGMFDFTADGADDIVVIAKDAAGDTHVGLYEYGIFYDIEGYTILEDASKWITDYYSGELTIPNIKEYLLGDNQKAEYPTWKEGYEQMVRIKNLDGGYKFSLAYVDGDDIPELVADRTGYSLYLYSFKDGHTVPLGYDFGYGAGGVGGYDYVPKKNCIKYYDSDYAGLIVNENFLSIHEDEIAMDYYCSMENYDDLNGNGYPDEDESTDEALANAKGSATYSAGDKSLSDSEIQKKIDELEKLDFEELYGQYDSVEFYNVLKKF